MCWIPWSVKAVEVWWQAVKNMAPLEGYLFPASCRVQKVSESGQKVVKGTACMSGKEKASEKQKWKCSKLLHVHVHVGLGRCILKNEA